MRSKEKPWFLLNTFQAVHIVEHSWEWGQTQDYTATSE
jgi:hypothetical protein